MILMISALRLLVKYHELVIESFIYLLLGWDLTLHGLAKARVLHLNKTWICLEEISFKSSKFVQL
jgi:hypothetical protein